MPAGELLGNAILRCDTTGPVKLETIKHQIVEPECSVNGAGAENQPVDRREHDLASDKAGDAFWAACCENALIITTEISPVRFTGCRNSSRCCGFSSKPAGEERCRERGRVLSGEAGSCRRP